MPIWEHKYFEIESDPEIELKSDNFVEFISKN